MKAQDKHRLGAHGAKLRRRRRFVLLDLGSESTSKVVTASLPACFNCLTNRFSKPCRSKPSRST
jgi:hypothetical protein